MDLAALDRVDRMDESAPGPLCPDENVFARRYAGELDEGELSVLEAHVAGCSRCERLLADLARLEPEGDGELSLGPGSHVGRYVLGPVLGAGAMGAVYAADDPELGRRVAIKLLRAPESGVEQSKLLREAQAMAQLNHPNVITVHDVGLAGGRVFVAMDLIEGADARGWRRARARSVDDVIGVHAKAGRGLAAAHRAGLVHRDVKPDNILVGDDGRVVVTDFGLAHAEVQQSETTGTHLGPLVSQTGALIGTPRYMSPEQFDRASVDPRTDQYSLCVSLYEGLFGQHPFASYDNLESLRVAIGKGHVPPPDGKRRVPAHVRTAIERGMSVDPDARYPNVEALVAALEGAPPRRLRSLVWGVLASAVVGTGAWAYSVVTRENEAERCADDGRSLQPAWNDGVRDRVRNRFVASGVPHAEASADKVIELVDGYVGAWSQTRTEACFAQRDDAEGSRADSTLWCLESQRMGLEALVSALLDAERATVNRAVLLAANLPYPRDCRGATQDSAPAPEQEAEVLALHAKLERAWLLLELGNVDEAKTLGTDVVEQELLLDRPRLAFEARLLLAKIQSSQDPEGAHQALEKLYFDAKKRGHPRAAARAAHGLTILSGQLRDIDEALAWSQYAESTLTGMEGDTQVSRADLWRSTAASLLKAGRYDEARDRAENALTVFEEELPSDHPRIATVLTLLASIENRSGRHDEARVVLERAVSLQRASLGHAHPDVADTLLELGGVAEASGDYVSARALYEESLEISSRGGSNTGIAAVSTSLGLLLLQTEDFGPARAHLERAAAATESAYGSDNAEVGLAIVHLALVDYAEGNLENARSGLIRGLTTLEASARADHPWTALTLTNLGGVEKRLGQLDTAMARFERALEIQRSTLDAKHPQVAFTLMSMAELQEARDEHEQARALFGRAAAILEQRLGVGNARTLAALLGRANADIALGSVEDGQATLAQVIERCEGGPLVEDSIYPLALRTLARSHLEEGQPTAAIDNSRKAVAASEAAGLPPEDVSSARFLLAKALWSSGRRHDARRMARAARDGLPNDRPELPWFDGLTAEIDAWLAKHG